MEVFIRLAKKNSLHHRVLICRVRVSIAVNLCPESKSPLVGSRVKKPRKFDRPTYGHGSTDFEELTATNLGADYWGIHPGLPVDTKRIPGSNEVILQGNRFDFYSVGAKGTWGCPPLLQLVPLKRECTTGGACLSAGSLPFSRRSGTRLVFPSVETVQRICAITRRLINDCQ
jgi:hypothetical protein